MWNVGLPLGSRNQTGSQAMRDKGSSKPCKFYVHKYVDQILATASWDFVDLQLLKFMPHKFTISDILCAAGMKALHDTSKHKCQDKIIREDVLLCNSASFQKSLKVRWLCEAAVVRSSGTQSTDWMWPKWLFRVQTQRKFCGERGFPVIQL